MRSGHVLQCFLNADLRGSHTALGALALKNGIDVKKLLPGQYVVFINVAKDRVKVFATKNILTYMKCYAGQKIDLRAIREIPKAFKSSGISYDEVLEHHVTRALADNRKLNSLQVFRASRMAGVM